MNEIYIFNIAKLAVKSIINTASIYPKPGLITPLDNNALDGVDYNCLIDSAMSLFQCFINLASAGADTESLKPMDAFTIMKSPAQIGVNDVLRASRGKLSLKGHILLLGLLSAAAGRLLSQKRILTHGALTLTASSFASGLIERELWPLEDQRGTKIFSDSERVYLSYGIEGCRGEAEHGFKMTLKAIESLRRLKATQGQLNFRERCTQTLIDIIAENQDSSLAAHGGITELIRVQDEAKNIIESGGMLSPEGVEAIFNMDKSLRSRGSSPSGSAVILSGALFIMSLAELKLTRSGYNEK
ncbi:MAG: triphosphoribosyl-dephospho-CoA synthase [Synergistaceae bacterium]|nr:triphosphoribosyl-dephospho-CoA synthase [Synergistaceae bacterium]